MLNLCINVKVCSIREITTSLIVPWQPLESVGVASLRLLCSSWILYLISIPLEKPPVCLKSSKIYNIKNKEMINMTESRNTTNHTKSQDIDDFEIFHVGDVVNVAAYSVMAVGRFIMEINWIWLSYSLSGKTSSQSNFIHLWKIFKNWNKICVIFYQVSLSLQKLIKNLLKRVLCGHH